MTPKHLLAAVVFATGSFLGQAAVAEELVAEYSAYIGQDDLYNSNGDRLTQPWQIIRQDRANYHKFGISQPGDQDDDFFGSASNRALAERMVRSGSISREARRLLLEGDCTVSVQVWRGDDGDFLNINVE